MRPRPAERKSYVSKGKLWLAAWLALAAVLVIGAVNRTAAKLGPEAGEGGAAGVNGAGLGETRRGRVLVANAEQLVLQTDDGGELTVEGQPWAYALAQGFTCQPDEVVTVIGYFEEDEFKASWIGTASGAGITLRDVNGRPAWAGQGRGRGG